MKNRALLSVAVAAAGISLSNVNSTLNFLKEK